MTMRLKQRQKAGVRPKRDDKEQSRLFLKKAREIGVDEEHSKADDLMRQLHKKPAEPHKKQSER